MSGVASINLANFLVQGLSPVSLPAWVTSLNLEGSQYTTDEARMRLAIELARRNVAEQTGGPFGSAIFCMDSGRLLGVGVNRVVPTHDPTAHGEITALRVAGALVNNFSLGEAGIRAALYSSASPCGMCCTALLWGGIRRFVYAATTVDVEAVGFDEGLKPDDWSEGYARRGIEVVGHLLRDEAVAVLQAYARSGRIYNG